MASLINNANKKVKIILNKILEEYELGTGTGILRLETKHFLNSTGLDNDQLLRILGRLEKDFVIDGFSMHSTDEVGNRVCIIKPLGHFRSRIEDYVERMNDDYAIPEPDLGRLLYLDKSGDFWHGNDKNNFCCNIGKDTIPYKIIRFLAENSGPQNTGVIASMLGGKNKRSVMNDIGEVRAKIKHQLKLDDVIKNERPDGYCIDPKYKIVIID